MDILIFGGTTEGRELAEALAAAGWSVTLSVATDYGAALVPALPGIAVSARRLDRGDMMALMASRPFAWVVDATHPYAAAATENIRAAAGALGLPYRRLLRPAQAEAGGPATAAEAARLLLGRPGNVLLTIGSKELDAFALPGLRERCFPRVLPAVSSLERCLALGFPPAHIICMQGPFSREMNEATLRQFAIKTLVTKDSGDAGGFRAMAEAAQAAGCDLLVIARPRQETGETLEEILKDLGGGHET